MLSLAYFKSSHNLVIIISKYVICELVYLPTKRHHDHCPPFKLVIRCPIIDNPTLQFYAYCPNKFIIISSSLVNLSHANGFYNLLWFLSFLPYIVFLHLHSSFSCISNTMHASQTITIILSQVVNVPLVLLEATQSLTWIIFQCH